MLGEPGCQQGISSSLPCQGAFLTGGGPARRARCVVPSAFSGADRQGGLIFLPPATPSPGSFPPAALPPAQTHTKVKRKEAPMTFLYLPASLSTSDVNEALHVLLLSKHRCFCFMGWWDGMELINQSASAALPHSCNFKARSHTQKKQKQNRQSLERELRCFDCASCSLSHLVPCSLTLVHSSFSFLPLSFPLTSFLLFPLPPSGATFSHTLVSHLHPFFFPHLPFF